MRSIAFILVAVVMVIAASFKTFAQKNTDQTREVAGFNSIASAGPFNVHVTLGNTESLKLSADAEVIDKIETVVEDNTLKIRFKNRDWDHNSYRIESKIDVYVNAKALKAVANAGSGSITVDGEIKADDFHVSVAGSGNVTAKVESNQLHATIAGSGSLNLSGNSEEVKASIAGSGQFNAKTLNASTASFVVSGSGSAYIKADKELSANIVGSGSVYYSGTAKAESHRIGAGHITKID